MPPPDAERGPTAGAPSTHNTSTPLTKKDHTQGINVDQVEGIQAFRAWTTKAATP